MSFAALPATRRIFANANKMIAKVNQLAMSAQMPTARQSSAKTTTGTATFGGGPGRFDGPGGGAGAVPPPGPPEGRVTGRGRGCGAV